MLTNILHRHKWEQEKHFFVCKVTLKTKHNCRKLIKHDDLILYHVTHVHLSQQYRPCNTVREVATSTGRVLIKNASYFTKSWILIWGNSYEISLIYADPCLVQHTWFCCFECKNVFTFKCLLGCSDDKSLCGSLSCRDNRAICQHLKSMFSNKKLE